MNETEAAFAVIYRWKIHEGRESDFSAAWETVTEKLRDERGGLGSRLHQTSGGSWLAYAHWPSREAWESSGRAGPVDEAASRVMHESIRVALEPILLDVVSDRL